MATVAAALCRLLTILRCMLVDVYDVLLAQMGASEEEWGWAGQAEAGGQTEGAGEENKQQGEEQKVLGKGARAGRNAQVGVSQCCSFALTVAAVVMPCNYDAEGYIIYFSWNSQVYS